MVETAEQINENSKQEDDSGIDNTKEVEQEDIKIVDISEEPEPENLPLEKLYEIQENIVNELNKVSALFENKNSNIDQRFSELLGLYSELNERMAYKDEAINRMQKRLEEYERGIFKSIKEAILKDIILFFDSLSRFRQKYESSPISQDEFLQETSFLQDELLEVLFSQNVEMINVDEDSKYDRDHQKVVKIEDTNNSQDHEKVDKIVRHGFKWDDRILRKQEVVIRKLTHGNTES